MEIQEPIDERPPTKLNILIIGAGVAGMLLALESKRLGISPIILERRSRVESAGTYQHYIYSCIHVLQWKA